MKNLILFFVLLNFISCGKKTNEISPTGSNQAIQTSNYFEEINLPQFNQKINDKDFNFLQLTQSESLRLISKMTYLLSLKNSEFDDSKKIFLSGAIHQRNQAIAKASPISKFSILPAPNLNKISNVEIIYQSVFNETHQIHIPLKRSHFHHSDQLFDRSSDPNFLEDFYEFPMDEINASDLFSEKVFISYISKAYLNDMSFEKYIQKHQNDLLITISDEKNTRQYWMNTKNIKTISEVIKQIDPKSTIDLNGNIRKFKNLYSESDINLNTNDNLNAWYIVNKTKVNAFSHVKNGDHLIFIHQNVKNRNQLVVHNEIYIKENFNIGKNKIFIKPSGKTSEIKALFKTHQLIYPKEIIKEITENIPNDHNKLACTYRRQMLEGKIILDKYDLKNYYHPQNVSTDNSMNLVFSAIDFLEIQPSNRNYVFTEYNHKSRCMIMLNTGSAISYKDFIYELTGTLEVNELLYF